MSVCFLVLTDMQMCTNLQSGVLPHGQSYPWSHRCEASAPRMHGRAIRPADTVLETRGTCNSWSLIAEVQPWCREAMQPSK